MTVELSTQTGDNPQTPIPGRFVTGKSVLVKDNQDTAAGSRLSFTNDERIASGGMDPMNSPQRITPDVGAGSHDVPIITRPINTTTHG
jgi:hypothetical protein